MPRFYTRPADRRAAYLSSEQSGANQRNARGAGEFPRVLWITLLKTLPAPCQAPPCKDFMTLCTAFQQILNYSSEKSGGEFGLGQSESEQDRVCPGSRSTLRANLRAP